MTDTDTFNEDDRVIHEGEGVRGTIVDIESWAPKFKVVWDDGFETLETFHGVKHVEQKEELR